MARESLLQYLKPSDREIIWVQGAKCEEGKTWFQIYLLKPNLDGKEWCVVWI